MPIICDIALKKGIRPERKNLIILEADKVVLFAGCAHNGIINILRKANEVTGKTPTHVFADRKFSIVRICVDACFLCIGAGCWVDPWASAR